MICNVEYARIGYIRCATLVSTEGIIGSRAMVVPGIRSARRHSVAGTRNIITWQVGRQVDGWVSERRRTQQAGHGKMEKVFFNALGD